MTKRLVSIMLVIVMLLSFSTFASAEVTPVINREDFENSGTVQPLYNYTNQCLTNLTKVNGKASCVADVTGYNGTTTKIEITMTLQKKTLLWWSTAETWTATYNTFYGTLTKSISVDSGTYRVKAVYKVYSGSNSESITSYSSEVKF